MTLWVTYWLDRIAHKLGYHPSDHHRAWWCAYAEDKLTWTHIRHNSATSTCPCKWCRRYRGHP